MPMNLCNSFIACSNYEIACSGVWYLNIHIHDKMFYGVVKAVNNYIIKE